MRQQPRAPGTRPLQSDLETSLGSPYYFVQRGRCGTQAASQPTGRDRTNLTTLATCAGTSLSDDHADRAASDKNNTKPTYMTAGAALGVKRLRWSAWRVRTRTRR